MAPTITSDRSYSEEHLPLTNKLRKPLVEKLRRDRINSSIEQLKSLLGPELHNQQSDFKLEKADILEMTVSWDACSQIAPPPPQELPIKDTPDVFKRWCTSCPMRMWRQSPREDCWDTSRVCSHPPTMGWGRVNCLSWAVNHIPASLKRRAQSTAPSGGLGRELQTGESLPDKLVWLWWSRTLHFKSIGNLYYLRVKCILILCESCFVFLSDSWSIWSKEALRADPNLSEIYHDWLVLRSKTASSSWLIFTLYDEAHSDSINWICSSMRILSNPHY